VVRRMGG